LYNSFSLGILGFRTQFCLRRRWIRSADGVRLLCCIAEQDSNCHNVTGFEGFAVFPGDDISCTVVWLCALHLLPWAPKILQRKAVLHRVSSLAGLREWLVCPGVKQVPGMSGLPITGARDGWTSSVASQSGLALRGLRRSAMGGLSLPGELDRASTAAQICLSLGAQLFLGERKASLIGLAHGLLPQTGTEVAQRFAARWAFASQFLLQLGQ